MYGPKICNHMFGIVEVFMELIVMVTECGRSTGRNPRRDMVICANCGAAAGEDLKLGHRMAGKPVAPNVSNKLELTFILSRSKCQYKPARECDRYKIYFLTINLIKLN